MDYRWSPTTLIIEGDFLAVSTGVGGGFSRVSALFNHTVPRDWHDADPLAFIRDIARDERINGSFYGLLTAVPMQNLVICKSAFLTVFITAGYSSSTINIIAVSREGLRMNALAEAIGTISSAKTAALLRRGHDFIATPTDAVIVACEGKPIHRYAGTATPLGRALVNTVMTGVPRALSAYENESRGPIEIQVDV